VGGLFDLWEANVFPQGVDLRHSQSHGKSRHRNLKGTHTGNHMIPRKVLGLAQRLCQRYVLW
jgi:hypothetical protein